MNTLLGDFKKSIIKGFENTNIELSGVALEIGKDSFKYSASLKVNEDGNKLFYLPAFLYEENSIKIKNYSETFNLFKEIRVEGYQLDDIFALPFIMQPEFTDIRWQIKYIKLR